MAAPFQGHVVDFIQVFPVTRFPVFNVADSGIVCGGVLAVFLAWRGYQIDGTRQMAEPVEDHTQDSAQDKAQDHAQDHAHDHAEGEAGKQAGERAGERADG
ncbi:hypothetical protein GCM10027612_38920 [Microbispora bryophytorum subsp. camponoti]